MLNHTDIQHRQLVLIHAAQMRNFCISMGNIVIKDETGQILTRLTRHQVLAIFIIGHCTLTSVMLDYCQKHGIALIALNSHLRPTLFVSHFGEANFLLRQRQYLIDDEQALWFARHFVRSKIFGHISLLKRIRKKDDDLKQALKKLDDYQEQVLNACALDELMGIEGNAARLYFKHHFGRLKSTTWQGRKPRLKLDPVNVVLDMGYTLLFNYVEANLRLFGFDVYRGMLHQLWYKRKSLVCDLVEPFRCIIDHQVVTSFNLGQFQLSHFSSLKHQYQLQANYQKDYCAILMMAIVEHKQQIFLYIRDFYRLFMRFERAAFEPKFPVFDLFDVDVNSNQED